MIAESGCEENRSVGGGELEQNRYAHGAERNQLDGHIGVVPEVIDAEAECRNAEQSSHPDILAYSLHQSSRAAQILNEENDQMTQSNGCGL